MHRNHHDDDDFVMIDIAEEEEKEEKEEEEKKKKGVKLSARFRISQREIGAAMLTVALVAWIFYL